MTKNYFTLLNLEKSLTLDITTLKKAYFKAQQQCHPDRATHNTQKLEFLQRSADVNQAYHTLKDFTSRLNYILKLNAVDIDSEKAPKAPPALLMESMEWREQWMACDTDDEKTQFKIAINAKIQQQTTCAIDAYHQNDIDAMLEAAMTLRYLNRMQQEIARG